MTTETGPGNVTRGVVVKEILRLAEQADGTPPVSDQALLSAAQGRRALLLFDGEGAVLENGADEGAARALGLIGEGELDLAVHPEARGHGVAHTALHTLLRQDRGSSSELRAWAHGENPAARALLEGAGFVPVRSLLRMTLDPALLAGSLAGARPLPEGFEVVSFDPAAPAHALEWVRVNAAAFASHPEQGAMMLEDFHALIAEPWFSADDLLLAFSTGSPDGSDRARLAGFTWVKTTREEGAVETELYVLGVDPAFAGIGLGAALLGATLRRMAEHDPRRISLYVDGDNDGARALYERAGFAIEQHSTQFALLNDR